MGRKVKEILRFEGILSYSLDEFDKLTVSIYDSMGRFIINMKFDGHPLLSRDGRVYFIKDSTGKIKIFKYFVNYDGGIIEIGSKMDDDGFVEKMKMIFYKLLDKDDGNMLESILLDEFLNEEV